MYVAHGFELVAHAGVGVPRGAELVPHGNGRVVVVTGSASRVEGAGEDHIVSRSGPALAGVGRRLYDACGKAGSHSRAGAEGSNLGARSFSRSMCEREDPEGAQHPVTTATSGNVGIGQPAIATARAFRPAALIA